MSDMSNVKTPIYTFGENIRKAREDMGWKQSDLAIRVKSSRAAVASWESNTNRPHPLVLDKIVELTGYPLEFFLGSDDDDKNTEGGDVSAHVTLWQLPGNWSREFDQIEPRSLLKLVA